MPRPSRRGNGLPSTRDLSSGLSRRVRRRPVGERLRAKAHTVRRRRLDRTGAPRRPDAAPLQSPRLIPPSRAVASTCRRKSPHMDGGGPGPDPQRPRQPMRHRLPQRLGPGPVEPTYQPYLLRPLTPAASAPPSPAQRDSSGLHADLRGGTARPRRRSGPSANRPPWSSGTRRVVSVRASPDRAAASGGPQPAAPGERRQVLLPASPSVLCRILRGAWLVATARPSGAIHTVEDVSRSAGERPGCVAGVNTGVEPLACCSPGSVRSSGVEGRTGGDGAIIAETAQRSGAYPKKPPPDSNLSWWSWST